MTTKPRIELEFIAPHTAIVKVTTGNETVQQFMHIPGYDSPDLMDGGMMCAGIEAEAGQDRWSTAIYQRDEAIARAETAERDLSEARQIIEARTGGVTRALTADDITDAMIRRTAYALGKWRMPANFEDDPHGVAEQFDGVARSLLATALTEPPARHDGAEELAELLRAFPGKLAGIKDISDHLASRGVGVVTAEEQS